MVSAAGRIHESMRTSQFRHFCTLVESRGLDLNARNHDGYTPLILASYMKNRTTGQAMARKLIQCGSDVTKADLRGRTILHHCVIRNHIPILNLLLDIRGINLNPSDCRGNTPLHLAVADDNKKMIEIFVHHMALFYINSDVRNEQGMTPLLLACQKGRLDVARLLNQVGKQSPMNRDYVTRRNARMWLETILFIPYETDPFNCDDKDLLQFQPKPLAYVSKDCLENVITYKWHARVCPRAVTHKRPVSAPVIIHKKHCSMISLDYHPEPIRAVTPSYRPIHSAHSHASFQSSKICPDYSYLRKPHSSCKQFLPELFDLQVTSNGLLPAAVPLPVTDADLSDGDDDTQDELGESGSHSVSQHFLISWGEGSRVL